MMINEKKYTEGFNFGIDAFNNDFQDDHIEKDNDWILWARHYSKKSSVWATGILERYELELDLMLMEYVKREQEQK